MILNFFLYKYLRRNNLVFTVYSYYFVYKNNNKSVIKKISKQSSPHNTPNLFYNLLMKHKSLLSVFIIAVYNLDRIAITKGE